MSASLFLLTAVMFVGACGPGGSARGPASHSGASRSASSPATQASGASDAGQAEKAALEQSFPGRESLGDGFGRLRQGIGNTLAATPKGVLSVTFAFVCTGGAKVSFTFEAGGKEVRSAAPAHTCGKSVFQQSLTVSRGGPVGFSADVTGSDGGGFAYSYYVEKKQLP
ncbi:hypothetical protein ABZT08_16630 [Streptomyces sp. NPDC005526]|uniref:hypothetical protein n=1 Tax=Streptomyces sp. NPDC005526 TaxID=3156885 RepID=UPI0033B2C959